MNGNLHSRTDHRNSGANSAVTRTETFTYDGADRLTSASVVGRAPQTYSYGYDSLGNLQSATELSECNNLVYGGGAFGPHQLAQYTCGGTSYSNSYDPNGSQTYTAAPVVREQTWTPFDKVEEVHTSFGRVRYTYDAAHSRVKKERVPGALSNGAPPVTPAPNDGLSGVRDTTIYPGSGYEKRALSGTTSFDHVFYLEVGGRAIAEQILRQTGSGLKEEWRYYHSDRQGTIERTTDGTGGLKELVSSDAWGVRRNPDWTQPAGAAPPQDTRYGYSGQQTDDEFSGIINMDGRTYDSYFKRFTSADPMVPEPRNGSSWNRYSYVVNNPTRYIDPTGYDYEFPFWDDLDYDFYAGILDGPVEDDGGDDGGGIIIVGRGGSPHPTPPPRTPPGSPRAAPSADAGNVSDGRIANQAAIVKAQQLTQILVAALNVHAPRAWQDALPPPSRDVPQFTPYHSSGYQLTREDEQELIWQRSYQDLRARITAYGGGSYQLGTTRVIVDQFFPPAKYVERAVAGNWDGAGDDLFLDVAGFAVFDAVSGAPPGAASAVDRATAVRGVLEPIAARQRVTAVLDTDAGRIVGSGVRDLSPAQRGILRPDEILATLRGAHGEITVIDAADRLGAALWEIQATQKFCPECRIAIKARGGVIISPTTAVFPGAG